MSQGDVIDWLQAHPGWHRPAAVARGLGRNAHKVSRILYTLWDDLHEIEMREIDSQRREYRYPKGWA